MKKVSAYSALAALLTLSLLPKAEAATALTLTDQFILAENGTVIPIGGDAATAGNSGNPSNGAAWEYAARERANVAQTDRRVVSFLRFDTSSLSVAQTNAAGFNAVFSINHMGHLNNVNPGLDLGLGQVVSGSWDDSGTMNPEFGWAGASSNQTTFLLQDGTDFLNLQNFPDMVAGLNVDVTSIVQDWVLNDSNQGLVLFGYQAGEGGNLSNGSYLSNASLEHGVIPEPSSSILALLGASALLFRRRRQ